MTKKATAWSATASGLRSLRYEDKGRYVEEQFATRGPAIDRLAALDRKGITAEVWQEQAAEEDSQHE